MTTTEANDKLAVYNPANGDVVATLPVDGPAEVAAAIDRARDAWATWRLTSAFERAEILRRFADDVRANVKELARLLSLEGGFVIWESEFGIGYLAEVFDFYAGLALQRAGSLVAPNTSDGTVMVRKDPVGVVAAVNPWNFPVELWAWKAAPALAAGNVVIAKPSPETPLTTLKMNEMLRAAGLPAGVHQVVVGGAETGAALVGSDRIDGIAFTGGVEAGKHVLRAAAENLTNICTLELSGHDACVVWDDSDVDMSAQMVAWGSNLHSGQVCVATERVYVASSTYDEFVAKLVEHTRAIVVGDPMDSASDIGPMMNAAELAKCERYVAGALQLGGKVETGGHALPALGTLFFEPTVITGLSHEQINELGEIFGPIVCVAPVEAFDRALELVNDNSMGLGASIITSDLARAMTAARDIRAGSVWINNVLSDTLGAPFGGFRNSGYGRELGVEGFESFVISKSVNLQHALTPNGFWFEHRDRGQADAVDA
jgi:acyl-CoA reductase-like NAD-dependent aldehyde dehydrogenase